MFINSYKTYITSRRLHHLPRISFINTPLITHTHTYKHWRIDIERQRKGEIGYKPPPPPTVVLLPRNVRRTLIRRMSLVLFAGVRSNRPPYLQCSSPPPQRYDLFPRKCRTAVDCLPRADLCCPENGRNVCRPPKAPRRWPRRFH